MKLATLRDGTRDGRLAVVRSDGAAYALASRAAPTLQAALDAWEDAEPELRELSRELDEGRLPGEPLEVSRLSAPLPRAYEWVDASAYLSHVRLVRRARGAEPPPSLETDPLVYQGGSGVLLGPTDDLVVEDAAWGADFEAEVCVVLGDVPRGIRRQDAGRFVRLVAVANDVSLRNLIPPELAKGFGFFQGKPPTAFAPFAVTPDALGPAWREGRVHLTMRAALNGEVVGECETGPEMHFSFFDLVEHIARTRPFTAGTLLGSGTVSNADPRRGACCLAERRMREQLEHGSATTRFLRPGDRVEINLLGPGGESVCGHICQAVVGR